MNFINAVLRKEGDDFWFRPRPLRSDRSGAGPPDQKPRCIRRQGGHLRHPSRGHQRCQDDPGAPDNTVVADVDVTEPMGAEVVVYFSKGDAPFIGRLDPHTEATDGEEHPVTFNMKKIHLFDKETEQVIS